MISESGPGHPVNEDDRGPERQVSVSVVSRVDGTVNEEQPFGMIESSERTVIDQVVDRLAEKFPGVPGEKVTDVVNACYAHFDGRPVRDFVPLFVERGARSQLAQISGS